MRFCIVGALGFIINLALLSLFFKVLGWPVLISQLLASEISLFNNFLLHNKWTYSRNNVSKTLRKLLIEFHAVSWIAVIGSSLLMTLFVHVFNMHYVLSLIVVSAVILIWNYGWTKFYVWRHEHKKETEE